MHSTGGDSSWMGTAFDVTMMARAWQDRAHSAEAEVVQLRQRVRELELALAVQEAHAGGLRAQKTALRQAHPNSPLWADSGRRFNDGDVKTQATLIYEQEFDRILRGRRISNPEKHRAD